MKTTIKTINFYYYAWVIMLIHLCVANSSLASFSNNFVSYIALFLLMLKMVFTKYTQKELILMVLVFLLGAISVVFSTDMRTLWFALFIIAAKNIDFNKIVKISFCTIFFCCISFIVFSLLGYANTTYFSAQKGLLYTFGLGHPNMASGYINILIILYIYLNFERLSVFNYLLFIILSVITYIFTKCVTGLIVILFIFIMLFVLKHFKKINMLLKRIYKYILLGLILLFTLLPITYNHKMYDFDLMLSRRISQANFYYQKYGANLFGNNVFSDLNAIYTDNILDGGYTRMLIVNGGIYYIFVVATYYYGIKKSIISNDNKSLILLSFFITYSCVENVGTYIFMNVTLLLFSKFIFKGDSYENS